MEECAGEKVRAEEKPDIGALKASDKTATADKTNNRSMPREAAKMDACKNGLVCLSRAAPVGGADL